MTKLCSKCKEEKEIVFFSKKTTNKDGLQRQCKQCCEEYMNEYRSRSESKDKRKTYRRRSDVKEKTKIYNKKYKNEYNSKIENKKKAVEYQKTRKKTDINFKISCNFRSRMNMVIKKQHGFKMGHSQELLGCEWETLRLHLEKQFRDGMTWENYGRKGWVIDHRLPVASFDMSDPAQQKKCWHYTNLQPLWWWENLEKSDKIEQLDYFL